MRLLLKIILLCVTIISTKAVTAQLTQKNTTFFIHSDTVLSLTTGGLLDRQNTAGSEVRYQWDLYRYYTPGYEPLKILTLKNNGTTQVDSIALIFNNKKRWQTLQSMADEVFSGYTTQKQKALAAWKFITDHHVYYYKPELFGSLETQNPVKFLTDYGYGDCFMINNSLKMLTGVYNNEDSIWYWGLNGGNHGVMEYKVDSGFAILDGDQQAFYLKPDNTTLASYDDIRMDPYLYIRTKHFPQANSFNSSKNYTEVTNYLSSDNFRNTFFDYGITDHSSYISLQPNEQISFIWDTATKYHQLSYPNNGPPPALNNILSFMGRGQLSFLPSVPQLQQAIIDSAGTSLILKMPSAFVLTGANLYARLNIPISNSITVFYSEDSLTWQNIYNTSQAGTQNINLLLDSFIAPLTKKAVYNFYIKLSLQNASVVNIATAIDSLNLTADFQLSKFYMPELLTGKNIIEFKGSRQSVKDLALSLNWIENNTNIPPSIEANPVFPGATGNVDSSAFTFQWQPATDADGDKIADYQFQLSDDSLLRFPLAPNFDVFISGIDSVIQPSFKPVITDFLNAGTPYYWRVRALDTRGAWSNWSLVWKFIPEVPMPPSRLDYDTTATGFKLIWNPSPKGNKPVLYKIMASNTRGFYPTYATVLDSTTNNFYEIPFAAKSYQFYRVVAIDKSNNQSTATDYVCIPDPLQMIYGNFRILNSLSDNGYSLNYTAAPSAFITLNNKTMIAKEPGKAIINRHYINDRNQLFYSDKQLVIVDKAVLNLKPRDTFKIYGTPNPEFKFIITNFFGRQSPTAIDSMPAIRCDANTFSNAGVYPVYPEGGGDDHYRFVFDTANLVIKKAPLKVSADTVSKAYGEDNPPLTYTTKGFAGSDNINVLDIPPEIKTTALKNSPAGSYEISISGAEDNNYSFEYLPGLLIIKPIFPFVSPNPSTGIFKVDLATDMIGKQLQVLDASGKKIYFQKISDRVVTIDLSQYPAGMYYLRIPDRDLKSPAATRKLILVKP